MNITEVIKKLEEIKNEKGDLPVVITENHEYWGTLYYNTSDTKIYVEDNAQPNGPKSGLVVQAVVIGNDF